MRTSEFVFGRSAKEKNSYIIEKMRKALSFGKKILLIVPEQQALFWDRECAAKLPVTELFNVETLSFSRLCDSIFREYGGTAKNYIDDAGKLLIMWRALSSVSDKIEVYRISGREEKYAGMFLHAVNEMKMYGVTPDMLLSASESLAGRSVAGKMCDLATVYAAYDAYLKEGYDDPIDMYSEACRLLMTNDFFAGKSVFVDSFFTLTPKETEILSYMFRLSDEVTVTFAGVPGKNDISADFVGGFIKEASRLASRAGTTPKKTVLPDDGSIFSRIFAELWDHSASPVTDENDRITLVGCNDLYDEAILVTERINKLVSLGARYSDIAVVAADFSSRLGICDTHLKNAGIPVYVSGKTPLTSESAVRLILSALSVVGGGFRKEDVVSLLKTRLTRLTPDECDAFEKYTEIWDIRGKKKYCGEAWSMNPAGYTDVFSDWGREMLRLANKVKGEICPVLSAFSEAFPGKIRDIAEATYKMMCDFGVFEKLSEETKRLQEMGKISEAQIKSQVFESVTEVLDTLARTVPDTVTDASGFANLLKQTANTRSVGSIPDSLDRVSVGSVGTMRLDGVRHLFVLGAVSGEFPAAASEDAFFTESDREVLKEAGISLSPMRDMRMSEALFRFSHTLSSPTDTLFLTVPKKDGEVSPSIGVAALKRMFPNLNEYDFCNEAGMSYTDNAVGACSVGSLSADGDTVSDETAKMLFGDHINLTQARIDSFNKCPFVFYCDHILKFSDDSGATLGASSVGTLVHEVLEKFMREAAEKNEFPVPDDVIVSRSDRLINEYLGRVMPGAEYSGTTAWTVERLRKNIRIYLKSLSDEFAQSDFRPYGFEMKVGYSDSLPVIPAVLSNGAKMNISGIVDRMDILRRGDDVYIRVEDYKTKNIALNVSDVRNGKNVQLFLYLFSLCDAPENCEFKRNIAPGGEKVHPAGALYFICIPEHAKSDRFVPEEDAEKTASADVTRNGIILKDPDIILAMDKEGSGKYAPLKFDKNGDIKMESPSLRSEEELSGLRDEMMEVLKGLGDKIVGGTAHSCPEKDACKYCSYKPLCRHSVTGDAASVENGDGGETNEK